MASPILSRNEHDQETKRDCRSDFELREANRHMHVFLDWLGHELRSPLGAISNALQILEVQGDDPAKREWIQNLMLRQVQSINRLVEDMREISHVEHGKIQLHKRFLDLKQVVVRAVETVRSFVAERGHQLEVVLPSEPVVLEADPSRLEQIVTNLLNNAAKFMEPGGQIWVMAESDDGDVVLRVRDSGIGIDPEMLPHVFDPFWQVERALLHSRGGLGIGLALVQKLAQMHGGSASAHSQGLGYGSEFVVRLRRPSAHWRETG